MPALARTILCCVAAGWAVLFSAAAIAEPPRPRPYDGIQAGLDAFHLAEEQRQWTAGQQRALSGALPAWPPFVARDELYAWGAGAAPWPAVVPPWPAPTVFEP